MNEKDDDETMNGGIGPGSHDEGAGELSLSGGRKVNRVIIFRPGAIGDTLLTFPALAALRRRVPNARITVVGNRPALEVGRRAGVLDEAIAFGADWVSDLFGDEATPRLKDRLAGFDLGIVWMHSRDAAADLAARLGRAGVVRTFAAESFPRLGAGRHLADHLVSTLGSLGVEEKETSAFTLSLNGGAGPSVAGEGGGAGRGLVVLHPGAGGRRKRWPADRFAAVARRLAAEGYGVALTRGPADEDAVDAVYRALGSLGISVLADLPLSDLAANLARARLFVGNDSGITHLAAMLGAPTLALFGPYDPAYWAPRGRRVVVLDAGNSCPHREDPREGCRQCALMDGLTVDEVWSAAEALLGAPCFDDGYGVI